MAESGMDMKRKIVGILFLLSLAGLVACGGSRNLKRMTLQERLSYAKKLFDDGKYLQAKTQFQIIVLNNPGSSVVDMAQFYLAESYFHLKEYITAAAEYEKLLNLYPRSAYVDDAQYKLGLAYYKLSPKADLDQKYTYRAIDEFQRFLEEYPQSEFVPKVAAMLQKCREKLAKKEFISGNLYRKMGYYRSAVIVFDEILSRYYDTSYAEDAYYWKAYCLTKIGKYAEARDNVQALLAKYPKTKFRERAVKLAETIDRALQEEKKKAANDRHDAGASAERDPHQRGI